jgi:hypothetical protein
MPVLQRESRSETSHYVGCPTNHDVDPSMDRHRAPAGILGASLNSKTQRSRTIPGWRYRSLGRRPGHLKLQASPPFASRHYARSGVSPMICAANSKEVVRRSRREPVRQVLSTNPTARTQHWQLTRASWTLVLLGTVIGMVPPCLHWMDRSPPKILLRMPRMT